METKTRAKSKKAATLAVLNDASLSTTQKVDKLLEIKQWGKEFKDIGKRVPGSRKEGAAIRAVYEHEDKAYMEALSREFDKYKLDDKTKQQMMENARETYGYEIGVQRLINEGDELKNCGNPKEAVGKYLAALWLIEEYRKKHKADTERADADGLWYKKAIFMASNGMGIAYTKWNKIMPAIDGFQDAIENAPDEKLREMAKNNLEKLKEAYEKKTGTRIHTFEQYPF
jgi:hypothetical protein